MNLTGQEILPVTQAQAWEALNDIEMLKSSIAGCDALNPIGENEYEALLSVSIGPVKANAKGLLWKAVFANEKRDVPDRTQPVLKRGFHKQCELRAHCSLNHSIARPFCH